MQLQLTEREKDIFNAGVRRGTEGTEEFVQHSVNVVADLLLQLKGSTLEACKNPEKRKVYISKAYKLLEILQVPE